MSPSSRLKILIISSHMKEPGGAEKNVIDLAAGLKDLCDVEVAALQGGYQLDFVRAAGVPAEDLDVRRPFSLDGLRKALRLYRKLTSEKFDLVL
ncbi:MAG: glycosyltransferase, partial [Elusimicrobia bacterium]|nr:glycosyltransferase [Elusimicrobiota bacterium]